MRTFRRIKELLRDGEWHREDELAQVAAYPREWVKELEYEHAEVAREDDQYLVRLPAA